MGAVFAGFKLCKTSSVQKAGTHGGNRFHICYRSRAKLFWSSMQTPILALPIVLSLLGALLSAALPQRLTPWLAGALAAVLCAGYTMLAMSGAGSAVHTDFWS